ncbi:MAG: glycosyltransferase family 4 protein, partial [Hyphomicrobiaceae bacterium]
AADAIFNFTARDRAGLADICAVERLHRLPPFLDLDATRPSEAPFPKGARGPSPTTRLVTVAMMRPGTKLASYRLLADSLAALDGLEWHLDIVGDGEARQAVEAAFAGLPAERLCFHGRLDDAAIRQVLASGDLFVWPGLEEAFGMAYLEAQAAGLPVAALRTAGVPEVVRHAETGYLADEATPQALATCIARLINDPDQRRRLGATAQAGVEEHHSLPAASAVLGRVLRQLVVPV